MHPVDMTEAALVAAAAALVVVAVVSSMRWFRRGGAPSGLRVVHAPAESWLAQARIVVAEGRCLARRLETVVEPATPAAPSGSPATDPVGELDDLTHQLASLSASAPTEMDVRVCRSVAVRSCALSDALRERWDDVEVTSDQANENQRAIAGRHAELVIALRDLEQQVNLL